MSCGAAAASFSSGNAVSMNGPGILMPRCRGVGAAVCKAPEKDSDSVSPAQTPNEKKRKRTTDL